MFVLRMALGSLLPLLALATALSFAKKHPPAGVPERCPDPSSTLLHPLNFSEDCQQNSTSLSASCAATGCVPCGNINTTTGPLCPQCNLQCAPWIDTMEANLTELSESQTAKECSTCQPCDFSRCIYAFCTNQKFKVKSIMDRSAQKLCLFNQCQREYTNIPNCFKYCDMVESGCGYSQSNTCKETQETYCSVPGREQQCAAACEMHDNCGDIVLGILDHGNETMDSFSAALSLTKQHSQPNMTGGCSKPLKSRLDTVNYFVQGASIRHFNQTSQRDLAMVFEHFLSDDQRDEWAALTSETVLDSAQGLLENIEQTAHLFAKGGDSFEFHGEGIVMSTFCAVDGLNSYSLFQNSSVEESSYAATVQIPVVHQSKDGSGNCHTAISAVLMRNLLQYLHNGSQSNTSSNSTVINTHIVTLKVSDRDTFDISDPVRLIFTPIMVEAFSNISCVFWDFNISRWSTVNVTTEVNDTHYICSTTHLTSFAILVTVSEESDEQTTSENVALRIVSYIGCAVSIVCLILTILVLVFMRKSMKKGCLTYIHLNLCTALLLAMVTFVAGIQTATGLNWLCTVVAALLHYLFLCVFCWMLAEGIMLYLLVGRVFGNIPDKWYYLLPLGWGIPIPIVVISVGIKHEEYGNNNYCWLSVDDGVIWAFAAPVLVVILINSLILAITVISVVRARKSSNRVTTRHLVVTSLKLSIVLLPLLGLTWIFGLLAVNDKTTVFAWLFCIFNSFQGFYLFVLHVARNETLRIVLKNKCLKGRRLRKQPSRSEDKFAVNGSGPVSPTTLTGVCSVTSGPSTIQIYTTQFKSSKPQKLM